MGNRGRSRRYATIAVRADGRRVSMPVPEPPTLMERLEDLVQRLSERFGSTAR